MANERGLNRSERLGAERRQVNRIDVLPDDILLDIFGFCMGTLWHEGKRKVEEWQSLVHVCQRWRSLVFGSPRYLNLQLVCTPETPARNTLDVWPAFPLIIQGYTLFWNMYNVVAALRQSNRVCRVDINGLQYQQLEDILAAMQVPFPELTILQLHSDRTTLPVIPDSFLDGSASSLQNVSLDNIPFPGLTKVLLSSTHLVQLWLGNIPHSGYISPEAMVALLSVLPSLKVLALRFQSPQSRPDWGTRRPPPSKRSIIPALTTLRFKGVIEYLEDFVTGIDTPKLDKMDIIFFNQIDFDTPRLAQFINRTPTLRKHKAYVRFHEDRAVVTFSPESGSSYTHIEISCREPDWQLSSIGQVCNSFHPLFTVEALVISHSLLNFVWKGGVIENTLWLQLLLPFTAVKNLCLRKEFEPGIAAALQAVVGSRVTEVLPSLRNIFVDPSGHFRENAQQFLAARQLSNRPVFIPRI